MTETFAGLITYYFFNFKMYNVPTHHLRIILQCMLIGNP